MAATLRLCKPLRFSQPIIRPIFVSLSKPQIRQLHGKRNLHEGNNLRAIAATTQGDLASQSTSAVPSKYLKPPLSVLPFGTLLRSYLITALSSSPILLSISLKTLSTLAHSESLLLNPDRNPLLRYILKKTFYAQFCAGETAAEVKNVAEKLKELGFHGVILGYAREVVLEEGQTTGKTTHITETVRADVDAWKNGTLETVKMADKGDQVALKFTGAGFQAVRELEKSSPPNKYLEETIVEICELAKAKEVRLLIDAEQHAVQNGIDAWTINFQERYNRDTPKQALIYNTYQAYKRCTPEVLARHLSIAREKGFTLGVKLVRGAYMSSDPRSLFWSQKEDTDKAYDGIAEALVCRRYCGILKPVSGQEKQHFPDVNLVLATHNLETVKKAMAIRKAQLKRGEERIHLIFGQIQGMADNVSCELIHAGKLNQELSRMEGTGPEIPQAYKYLVWGTVGECMKYLLRRGEENRDAVSRTKDSRLALRSELGRRLFGV